MPWFPAHGGDLGWASRRYGIPPSRFLDFSSSVNPLGPAPSALRAAKAALRRACSYPEPFNDALKKELASWLGISPAMLMLGNGSTELIHHLVRCRSPRRVTVVSPSFSEYWRAARSEGSEVEHFLLSPDDGFALDVQALIRMASRSEMVFFCNPASPSGALYKRKELMPLLEACRSTGSLLVVDESFMGFCSDEERDGATMVPVAGEEGLVVLSTLTKLFALAGFRGPGWLAATRGLIEEMESMSYPWRVNIVAEAAARASLKDWKYLRNTRLRVSALRDGLYRELQQSGPFWVYEGHANFLLLRLPDVGQKAVAVADRLARRGILVRPCHDFHGLGGQFIRVAVRKWRENARLVKALREVWRELEYGA